MASEEKKLSKAELKAQEDLLMAKAAIKLAITSFSKGKRDDLPDELELYWSKLDKNGWQNHLKIFTQEIKKSRIVVIKKILFDLENYIKDCRKLVPDFKRSREELLLMIAIGQIDPKSFTERLDPLPSNKEKLDRKIHKQIKELDWLDDIALIRLDELTKDLDKERIKKDEMARIEEEIKKIENEISERKSKREELAIKLVEWRARGNMDIASADGKFRLDA